jgi:hypothetical protein
MRKRFTSQEGWALVTATTLMAIMLTIGLAAIAFVDTETQASRLTREREARLNLTEGAMASQIFQMSRKWPASAGNAFPDSCTQSSTQALCPRPSQVLSHFAGVDFKLDPQWTIQVRDNPQGPYYDDTQVLANPNRWDANGDGEMWVRAEGRLGTRKRVVVARVRVERRPLSPPVATFIAGTFGTGNSGNKTIVNTGVAPGIVRCDTTAPASHKSNACMGFDPGQVQGAGGVTSNVNAPPNAISPGLMEVLKETAAANGTYYKGSCPSNPSGDVVYVEAASCNYNNGSMSVSVVNATSKKGMFIVDGGTLSVTSNITWYGVLYVTNTQNCGGAAGASPCISNKGFTDVVADLSGNVDIQGAMFVDGPGRLLVGESKNNLTYNANAVQALTAFGTAGIIQNTWRELTAG